MENLGKVTLFLINVITMILSSILFVYIFIQIAEIYDLKFITQFTFVQTFGIIILVRFVTREIPKNKENNDTLFVDEMTTNLKKTGRTILFLLGGWGLAWLMFQILS